MKKILISFSLMFFAIMLRSQVIPEWVNIFSSPGNAFEAAADVAISDSGLVFVTGTGFQTIKYNASGGQVWERRYTNGYANVLAVDDAGGVIVAGAVEGGESGYDYGVIKFDAGGLQQWLTIYQGPGSDDQVNDLALDNQGYIYVTGASAGIFSSMWCDYATLKISPFGDTVWSRRFGSSSNDRGLGIAVSDSGFVYVTGYCDGGVGGGRYNYGTIKYAPNGDTLWVRYYNGTGNDDDFAYDIDLDPAGNVIVTGYSWGIYDDYATVKYNAAGTQLWVARYNGPVNSFDKAYALVVDGNGNSYVTGASGGLSVTYDYTTVKYSPSGGELWVARYDGPGLQDDYAQDIALDSEGNVYVTGYSDNPPSPYIKLPDIATVKYNNNGIEQWISRYNGPNNYKDYGNAIATDGEGNAYVAGHFTYYQSADADMVTLKYGEFTGQSESIADRRVSIYPNPVLAALHIALPADADLGEAEIFDSMGRKMLKTRSKQDIDVSNLLPGLYFLSIQVNDTRQRLTFVKE